MKHLYKETGEISDKLLQKDIVIWGCGNDGKKLYHTQESSAAKVRAFCDSNQDLIGTYLFHIPVISSESLREYSDCNLALAFFRWKEIMEKIPEEMLENCYADFLFLHKDIENGIRCLICGGEQCTHDKAHFAPFLTECMFEGSKKPTQLIHCQDCGVYYSEYRPNSIEMDRLYKDYRGETYVKQRIRYEPEYTADVYYDKEVEGWRKKRLGTYLKENLNIENIHYFLDYGGDNGGFIPDEFNHACRYVYDISGVDVVPGVCRIKSLEELKNYSWDLITCCHVLEHVSDPLQIVEIMADLLHSGSYLYIEVPYENWFKQYSNVEINEHINFFDGKTMELIAKKFSLSIVNNSISPDHALQALYQKY